MDYELLTSAEKQNPLLGRNAEVKSGYIQNKAIIIEKGQKRISPLNLVFLQEGLPIAQNPQEAGTIIFIHFFKSQEGQYGKSSQPYLKTGTAYRTNCTLSVVDYLKKKEVDRQRRRRGKRIKQRIKEAKEQAGKA